MRERLKNKLFQHIRDDWARNDFKGCHFDAMIIIQATNKYLRYCLSYRDIEELLLERDIKVDLS